MKSFVVKALSAAVTATALLIFPGQSFAGGADGKAAVSANIPLDSFIYDDLEKLDGMGYIQDMRIGMKPYTRLQAARWVMQASGGEREKPAYLAKRLEGLKREFAAEIRFLQGQGIDSEMGIKEWRTEASYYDGTPFYNTRSTSFYQPLHINNNGYSLGDGGNFAASLRVEKSLDESVVMSVTPRFDLWEDDHEVTWQSAYLKTRVNNVEISFGKDPLWWGQGQRGTLALSNNAKPLTYLKLTNPDPVRLGWWKGLGNIYSSAFYAQVSDQRRFDGSVLERPGFVGMRMDFVPTDSFTFGIMRTSILDHLSAGNIKDFLLGTNAEEAGVDKWNSIAGIDFRWRLPHAGGMQLYGEVYGEDQSHELGFIPVPSKKAYIAGLYIPKLTENGRLEANIEYGHTSDVWYNHWVFTDGYVNDGHIIGDAMGNDAERYYVRLTRRYGGGQVSLHAERLNSREIPAAKGRVDSFWLSGRMDAADDIVLEGFFGISRIDHAGSAVKNYKAGIAATKYF